MLISLISTKIKDIKKKKLIISEEVLFKFLAFEKKKKNIWSKNFFLFTLSIINTFFLF